MKGWVMENNGCCCLAEECLAEGAPVGLAEPCLSTYIARTRSASRPKLAGKEQAAGSQGHEHVADWPLVWGPAPKAILAARHVQLAPAVSLPERRLRSGQPLVSAGGNLAPGYQAAKRVFDLLGTLGLLMLLGPVMLAVFLILLVTMRGKALFIQRRVGYRGRIFSILKFRTMRLDADRMQHTVANEQGGPVFKNRRDPRVTRLGRLLRKTSLDETPQLFNVLLGHMSLVGPRPLVIPEVVRLQAWQRRRLAVKPGLTCLWQVSGRSEIGFDDWARMDLWYARHQSFATDCKLLLQTPLSVLSGRGAY
jgi:lipopolysaccharide/colanic/teichoic acid biosynthesis glycosyltransferase